MSCLEKYITPPGEIEEEQPSPVTEEVSREADVMQSAHEELAPLLRALNPFVARVMDLRQNDEDAESTPR